MKEKIYPMLKEQAKFYATRYETVLQEIEDMEAAVITYEDIDALFE